MRITVVPEWLARALTKRSRRRPAIASHARVPSLAKPRSARLSAIVRRPELPRVHPTQFSFGDNVEVCNVVTTRDLALAGLKGAVFGVTTPSVTGVEVIGTLIADVAINVHFPSLDKDFWFAPELLEFLDHGAGTVITIGTHKLVRNGDGSWFEEKTPRFGSFVV